MPPGKGGRMEDIMEYYLGFALGALVVAIIGVLFLFVMKKYTKTDNSLKSRYDERQQLVRGTGFKYGFFSLMFYNVAAAFLISVEKRQYIEHAALMLAGILFGVFIYGAYCIWNESYFSLNENPKRVVIVFVLIALLNFGVGYRGFCQGVLIEDGMLTVNCLNIFVGVLVLMLFFVMVVKHICKEK